MLVFISFYSVFFSLTAVVISDVSQSPKCKWWVKKLMLQDTERSILENGQMLNDLHVHNMS